MHQKTLINQQKLQSFRQEYAENKVINRNDYLTYNEFNISEDQLYYSDQKHFKNQKTQTLHAVNQQIQQKLKVKNYIVSQILYQSEEQNIFGGFQINSDQQKQEFIFQEIKPSQIQCVHRDSAIIFLEKQLSLKQVEKIKIEENQIIVFNKCDIQLILDIPKQVWNKQWFEVLNENIRFPKIKSQLQNILSQLEQKNYYLCQYIANGGEGVVFKGYQVKDGKYVNLAFKIYNLGDTKDEKEIEEEINIMSIFEKTINVVQIFDFIKISQKVYILVFELCHKSLKDELNQIEQGEFSLFKLLKIIFDLIDGLIELRIYNILHLDIKPDNILINSDGNYVYADFGLSSLKTNKEQQYIKGYSKSYSPSEIMKLENDLIDFKSDVYSYGQTLLYIIKIFLKSCHASDKIIAESIENILRCHVVQENINQRLDCFELHTKFLDFLFKVNCKPFLEQYLNKIPKILKLSPYDKNKDSKFFLKIELYFHTNILNLQKYLYEGNNADIARTLNNVGLCYKNLGDNKRSMLYLQESLEMRRQIYSKNHPELARSYNNVGICYQNLENNDKALIYLKKSLKMRNQIIQGNHSDVAKSLNNLALCYINKKQYDKALKKLEKSLEIKKKDHIEQHPCVATTLNNIGTCHFKLKDYEKALENQQKSLNIYKIAYKQNSNHVDIANTLNNVGLCYLNSGKIDQALINFEESLNIYQKVYQNNHTQIAILLYNISLCYKATANQNEQINNLDKSFNNIQQKVYNKQTAVLYNDIGLCFFDLGLQNQQKEHFSKSLLCFIKSLEIVQKVIQNDVSLKNTCLNNIYQVNLKIS
ncbi:tetratricopeptide repeat protein (macronuclear) [Tetrahymena thermophila SB210]|uniref:Tetratricopeptide repeat protein n=1 Tax=Tetrahymena thermophila (strain SB210) TaxID=312017 RepID=Q23MN3_TETTS|nr:tetratricopeptide repeat protein [Tetrahymena thermophila SB210]EAR97809.2 tetratricopeptide repeat protein [Tetrahymena thermophila SB210]|eukprot:XP_001018054.2 tetratricopeptide repeat protein [Tetrahymena thermophila SB210]